VQAPQSPSSSGTELQTYVVQVGDTLAEIAITFNVPLDVLVRANNISDPDHIEVGQELVIPPG
jgi:LysM repeat protein